jgi:TRAP-type uncharacterized transport system substrate-binding protein
VWQALFLITVLALTACESGEREIEFYAQAYRGLNQQALQEIFSQQAGLELRLVDAKAGQSAARALIDRRANVALVNNSRPFHPGLRAVVPVYESVLHVLAGDQLDSFELTDSLKGLEIYIADNSLAGRTVVDLLIKRQRLSEGDYRIVSELDPATTDLIIYFGPIDPGNLSWFREGYSLVDLGEATTEGGVRYLLPRMRSKSIPARTYDLPGNERTLRTVAVMTLLVTHKDMPEQVIYDLTETLIEQKPRFMSIAPGVFSGVTDQFSALELNFPLHSGARRYLQRDEPSLIERYAETINLLVYLSFLLLTGAVAAYRWRAYRKRDRIDDFYLRTLLLRKQAGEDNFRELLDQLSEMEEEAFRSLIEGKLAADESFRILTELLARSRRELIDSERESRSSAGSR